MKQNTRKIEKEKKKLNKFIIIALQISLFLSSSAFAVENSLLNKELNYQNHINEVGINLLNSNKIDKKIVFTYNKGEYKKTPDDSTISKRQIIFYEDYFKYVENDDELAAFLAHQISRAVKSYSGEWGGFIASAQIKAAPKKYEIFADKRAVDYMVKAGYNPLGLITYINKSQTNGFLDKILFHNSPSKRQAIIYEYIYYNYPYYLKNNTYLTNKNYQNFLLTSSSNRALLKEKIKSGSKKELKYE